MSDITPVVHEYEVFKNGKNALAFFMSRHPILDMNAKEGPFWFTVQDHAIIAGTEEYHAIFEGITDELADIARQRGVLMLVEFENQKPYRCTPCYLSDNA